MNNRHHSLTFYFPAEPDPQPYMLRLLGYNTDRQSRPLDRDFHWIGVDFDGTLVKRLTPEQYGDDRFAIGEPVVSMCQRVKRWLSEGIEVRIVTARVASRNGLEFNKRQRVVLRAWCQEHIGQTSLITAEKDFDMYELWDDSAVGVIGNTGLPAGIFEQTQLPSTALDFVATFNQT